MMRAPAIVWGHSHSEIHDCSSIICISEDVGLCLVQIDETCQLFTLEYLTSFMLEI